MKRQAKCYGGVVSRSDIQKLSGTQAALVPAQERPFSSLAPAEVVRETCVIKQQETHGCFPSPSHFLSK